MQGRSTPHNTFTRCSHGISLVLPGAEKLDVNVVRTCDGSRKANLDGWRTGWYISQLTHGIGNQHWRQGYLCTAFWIYSLRVKQCIATAVNAGLACTHGLFEIIYAVRGHGLHTEMSARGRAYRLRYGHTRAILRSGREQTRTWNSGLRAAALYVRLGIAGKCADSSPKLSLWLDGKRHAHGLRPVSGDPRLPAHALLLSCAVCQVCLRTCAHTCPHMIIFACPQLAMCTHARIPML